MADQYVDFEFFQRMVKQLMRLVLIVGGEVEALRLVLEDQGLVPHEALEAARKKAREALEPSIRRIDDSDAEKLLELLRRFEGPPQ